MPVSSYTPSFPTAPSPQPGRVISTAPGAPSLCRTGSANEVGAGGAHHFAFPSMLRISPPSQLETPLSLANLLVNTFKALEKQTGIEEDLAVFGQAYELLERVHSTALVAVEHHDAPSSGETRDVLGVVYAEVTEPDCSVRGLGPIAVRADTQGKGVGRKLILAAMERAALDPTVASMRLMVDSYNPRSFSMYLNCGMEPKMTVALLKGCCAANPVRKAPASPAMAGFLERLAQSAHAHSSGRATSTRGLSDQEIAVCRPMCEADIPACVALHRRIAGFSRESHLRARIASASANLVSAPHKAPFVVDVQGRIAAFASCFDYEGFSVAEHETYTRELLLHVSGLCRPLDLLSELVVFVPVVENASLLHWGLGQSLKLVKTMQLMVLGEYKRPGADGERSSECVYTPSVIF